MMFLPPFPVYRNKKNGGLYEVIGRAVDATNCRNGADVLIYRPMGSSEVDSPRTIYVRELSEFNEKFEVAV